MRKHHAHARIYRSRLHLLVTVLFIVLPFLFFLFFARFAQLSIHELFNNISTSVIRLVIAYVISVVFAWVFAVLFYQGKRAIIALPVFDVLQSFPTFAALPIAISQLPGQPNGRTAAINHGAGPASCSIGLVTLFTHGKSVRSRFGDKQVNGTIIAPSAIGFLFAVNLG